MPVFKIRHTDKHIRVLVLNASSMGKIVQFSPLETGDEIEFKQKEFYIRVRAYTDEEELLTERLANPPEWLKKEGNEEEREEVLKGRVLIDVWEKFNLKIGNEFEGYLINF